MSGINRALRILGLFSPERPVLKPEWLIARLGVSRASVYRDLGELTAAGLVERVADRGYVLGPAVVELDRQMRLADPLIEAAGELLDALAAQTGGAVLLCIHQVNGRNPALSVSYERGRAMPLYRGATSKVILACLPLPQLKQLWAAERETLVGAGLPNDFAQLQKVLRGIRDVGYYITEGEVDPDAMGFAVPLRDGEHLLGSLSVVMPVASMTPALRKATLSKLQSAARRIEGRLQDQREKARALRKTETA